MAARRGTKRKAAAAHPLILADQAVFEAAVTALGEIDPALVATTIADRPLPALRRRAAGLEGLVGIVVSQQVSTASAAAIYRRLQDKLGAFDADAVHGSSDTELKLCGLSAPKLRTLRALATAQTTGTLDFAALAEMDAEAAHASLCALHGIGPWTADVFLLFCLGHADAWPAGDLALQEAAKLVLGLDARPDTKAMIAIGERWRPLRGVAAQCLWAYYGATRKVRTTLDAPAPEDATKDKKLMAELDGPRLGAKNAQASAATGKPGGAVRQLVVLLHGYGADGKDLIEIGRQWQALLPDAAFVAPNAPEPCAQAPMGRQWFALTSRDPDERWLGVNKAQPVLDAFLDAELARQGLGDDKLALVGFSQGTMMALHVGLRRRRSPAAIVGFSGTLVGPEHLVPPQVAPPILLTHGSNDEVIPADAMFIAAEDLAEVGIPSQWHISAGVGHGIDGAAMTHAGLFLAKAFGLRTAGAVPPPSAGR